MTLDETIQMLQEIKELHPMAGRMKVIRYGKKGEQQLVAAKHLAQNSSMFENKILLKFY